MPKLQKFNKKENSQISSRKFIFAGIIILIILSIFVFYKSYAIYKIEKKYDVIKSQIGEFDTEDMILSFTIDGNKEDVNFPSKNSNYIVNSVTCENGTSANWDNETWSLTNIEPGDSKKIRCNIDFKGAYKENILNGTDPVLKNNLVPVNIADDGTVTKANIEEEWYSYENKRWANAVVLVDDSITYNNDQTIPESNIESYFVWIPNIHMKYLI